MLQRRNVAEKKIAKVVLSFADFISYITTSPVINSTAAWQQEALQWLTTVIQVN